MAHVSGTSAVQVFSPHLDDGVLSASARLMAPGTELVTVFAGDPPADLAVTSWGRLTGATSMQERHTDRLAEDARAAAILGCRPIHLDEREEEYRDTPVDLAALAARVASLIRPAREVWAPAAIGGHRDHELVRDAVLTAWAAEPRTRELYLYADLPYALDAGWPAARRTGEAASLDARMARLVQELTERGPPDLRLHLLVRWLTSDERQRKADAVQAYASQLQPLGLGPSDADRWDELVGCEVAWRVTAPA